MDLNTLKHSETVKAWVAEQLLKRQQAKTLEEQQTVEIAPTIETTNEETETPTRAIESEIDTDEIIDLKDEVTETYDPEKVWVWDDELCNLVIDSEYVDRTAGYRDEFPPKPEFTAEQRRLHDDHLESVIEEQRLEREHELELERIESERLDEIPPETRTFTITPEHWGDFLVLCEKLKRECNDIDIKGSVLRQRSNDKTTIVESDLTAIFGGTNADISISNVAKKLEHFKSIDKKNPVTITVNCERGSSKDYVISDANQDLKLVTPAYQFIDNKFMTYDELDAIFTLEPMSVPFVEYIVTPAISKLILGFMKRANIKAYQVVVENGSAHLSMNTQAKDQFLRPKVKVDVDENFDSSNEVSLNCTQLPLEYMDKTLMNVRCYKDPEQDISLNFHNTTYGKSLPVKFYTRSSMITTEE